MNKTILLLAVACTFFTQNIAQLRDSFDHLQSIPELANRSVTAIAQDEKGFIWFGSSDGLLRYDGFSVKVYKNDKDDINSLSDNNIRDLFADHKGNLWIATQGGGLNRLRLEKERFTRYQNEKDNPHSISSNVIWALLVDSQGNLWAGSWSDGINKLDIETGQFTRMSTSSSDPARAIYEDEQGGIWYSAEGLTYYDPKTDQKKIYASDPTDTTTLSSNSIRTIIGDKSGNIWVATDNAGLNRLDPRTGRFQRFSEKEGGLNSDAIYDIHIDKEGILWLATDNGLNIFNYETGEVTYLQHDPTEPLSLSNNNPRVIFEDKTGALWVGNEGGRINKTIEKKAFVTYNQNNGFRHNLIRSLFEDEDGKIWVGTQGGGLHILDRKTGEIEIMATDTTHDIYVPSLRISALYKDEKDVYWVGTWGDGIFSLDYATREVRHYKANPSDPNSLPDNRIQVFHLDKFGTFWVGTENGLAQFDRNGRFTRFGGLNATNIQGQAFVEEPDGTLWVGTWNGINRISPDRSTVESWPKADDSKSKAMSSEHVISMHRDQDGILWLGTFGGGLNRFDPASEEFIPFTEDDGLPNGVIYGIRGDRQGNLWMSTNNGLSRFSPETKVFRNYDKAEGIQSNEFYWGASYGCADGSLAFGGVNGLNVFDPADIQDNAIIPPVVISDFQIYNKPVSIGKDSTLEKSIVYAESIDLSYKDAVITFSFAALNFNHAEKNQYAYKLEGFEDDWNYVGNRHSATYTNLDPGSYTFRVKGSNNDNVWNEEGVSLAMYIQPPFWRTWWFYLTIGLSVFGLVRTFVKYREKQLERDKILLESKIQEARDEVDRQKRAIEEQREKEKERIWKDQTLVQLGEILSQSKNNIRALADDVLRGLVKHLEVTIAAVYVAQENEEGETVLNRLAHYGYSEAKAVFSIGAGLVGECFVEREVNYIQNLPDSYLKVESGLGESSPAVLLLIPLKYEDIIVGVMEIASFHQIPDFQRDFLIQFSERLTTAINTTLLGEKTTKLLEESKVKEEELKIREEELQQNLEEMQAINEDGNRRTRELEQKITELEKELELSRKNTA